MSSECWRQYQDTPYEVSDFGRVRRILWGGKRRLLKPKKSRYVTFTISMHNEKKTVLLHRIVAEAFLGTSNGLCVNHINGDRHDNRAVNLEYVTYTQNSHHAWASGLYKRKARAACGHDFSGVDRNGRRFCSPCRKRYYRNKKYHLKQQVKPFTRPYGRVLSDADVEYIRTNDISSTVGAKMFHVSRRTINYAKSGQGYKHVALIHDGEKRAKKKGKK